MEYFIGYAITVGLPAALGALSIWLPFRSYSRTRIDRFLTAGVICAVFGGTSILALVAAAVLDGYPSVLAYLVIAVCFMIALILEFTKPTR